MLTFKIESETNLHVEVVHTITVSSLLHWVKTKVLSIKESIPLRRDTFVVLQI